MVGYPTGLAGSGGYPTAPARSGHTPKPRRRCSVSASLRVSRNRMQGLRRPDGKLGCVTPRADTARDEALQQDVGQGPGKPINESTQPLAGQSNRRRRCNQCGTFAPPCPPSGSAHAGTPRHGRSCPGRCHVRQPWHRRARTLPANRTVWLSDEGAIPKSIGNGRGYNRIRPNQRGPNAAGCRDFGRTRPESNPPPRGRRTKTERPGLATRSRVGGV